MNMNGPTQSPNASSDLISHKSAISQPVVQEAGLHYTLPNYTPLYTHTSDQQLCPPAVLPDQPSITLSSQLELTGAATAVSALANHLADPSMAQLPNHSATNYVAADISAVRSTSPLHTVSLNQPSKPAFEYPSGNLAPNQFTTPNMQYTAVSYSSLSSNDTMYHNTIPSRPSGSTELNASFARPVHPYTTNDVQSTTPHMQPTGLLANPPYVPGPNDALLGSMPGSYSTHGSESLHRGSQSIPSELNKTVPPGTMPSAPNTRYPLDQSLHPPQGQSLLNSSPHLPPDRSHQNLSSQPPINTFSTATPTSAVNPHQPYCGFVPGSDTRLPPVSPPMPPVARQSPAPPNIHQSRKTQGVTFRTVGTAATAEEWNRIKIPIGLLHERKLLPSDGADIPPRPAINQEVNCDPDIMRCTLTSIPATSKLLSTCRLPLGLLLHPFRDLSSLPTINSGLIVRCRKCRTYINPFVQFLDSGRRWRCPICFIVNGVPDAFFYDPHTQTYGDPTRRPEIQSTTVEFIAPSEYMLRPPQAPTYLFCFDVSRNAIATGYLRFACDRLASLLTHIPGAPRRQITFITFDSAVHYYKLCGDTMHMMLCPDLDELFIPDCEGLINHIDENIDVLRKFIRRLPDLFKDTQDVGSCLGSALQIGLELIGSIGGRISTFVTCLPSRGVGSLQNREELNDRTSPDAKSLGPAIDFYKTFALDCAAKQVAVDLFIFNSQYCDLATISSAARHSSGSVYHYPNFYYPHDGADQSTIDDQQSRSLRADANDSTSGVAASAMLEVERFRHDFHRYLRRKVGFDAVMRIRCTHGLSIQAFHGSFFVRSTDLTWLSVLNPDAGYAVQLNISESLEHYSAVCCQAALLYTSSDSVRRIRVHTLCLPVVNTCAEVFQGADQGAIACLIAKMAVDRSISAGIKTAREAISNAVVDTLCAFASSVNITQATSVSSYGLACPPNLRLLPLYLCGLLRYRAFRTSTAICIDDRFASLDRLKTAPHDYILTLIYPKLYAVHEFVSKTSMPGLKTLAQHVASLSLADYGDAHELDCDDSSSSSGDEDIYALKHLPPQLPLTTASIASSGVYLLDTGEMMFLLVGTGEDATDTSGSETLHSLLNIYSPNELPKSGGPFGLPPLKISTVEPTSDVNNSVPVPIARRRLSALLTLLRCRRPINSVLLCIRNDVPADLQARFLNAFIEDRNETDMSYFEYLQSVGNLLRS